MGFLHISFLVSFFLVLHPAYTSPIMVKFGTKEGPIVPAPPKTTTIRPTNSYPGNPAPVYENQDDTPNPNVYKPLTPHQYRKQIYKYKPSPNLILGTPLDIKYTPSLYKYNGYQKIGKPALGFDYQGPQTFGVQEYEKDYHKEQYNKYQNQKAQEEQQETKNQNTVRDQDISSSRTVPQIGIIYSSGVRYYVPQIVYYNDDIDNSVYEANDLKYYYHNQKQNNYY